MSVRTTVRLRRGAEAVAARTVAERIVADAAGTPYNTTWPHCDQRVLHAPGECEYCDKHGELQAVRESWGINFTGHHDPEKYLCPAEDARSLSVIERWGGNVKAPKIPTQAEMEAAREELERLFEALS